MSVAGIKTALANVIRQAKHNYERQMKKREAEEQEKGPEKKKKGKSKKKGEEEDTQSAKDARDEANEKNSRKAWKDDESMETYIRDVMELCREYTVASKCPLSLSLQNVCILMNMVIGIIVCYRK